jgi:two-component system LytT family response regulator
MLRTLIVEDDPFASELLTTLLRRHHAEVEVLAVIGDFETARARLAQADYDLVFLDVQLVAGSGFDLVPFVPPHAWIVFITGSEQHALRAFEVNALDYIVKPITARRLDQCLRRALSPPTELDGDGQAIAANRIYLRGRTASGRFVPLESIVAVLSSENYTEVLLDTGERSIVRRTMKAWEDILPADVFMRVHRTVIANCSCIERVVRESDEQTSLTLRGHSRPVPVSRRIWARLKPRLDPRLRE